MNNINSNGNKKPPPPPIIITEEDAAPRLALIRQYVARPIQWGSNTATTDPQAAEMDGGILIGSKYHAADVPNLLARGVTAVLNCASGGISRLPVEELKEKGIRYAFTNVRQDDYNYPILHDAYGSPSKHLQVARQLYDEEVVARCGCCGGDDNSDDNDPADDGMVVDEDDDQKRRRKGSGKVLFFCVAGMNRSAALAIAVLMSFGHRLDDLLEQCAQLRPFILENKGFQRQLVELEVLLRRSAKRPKLFDGRVVYLHGERPKVVTLRTASMIERESMLVEIELLIPGLCTMDVKIPVESSIAKVKEVLVNHANEHLLSYGRQSSSKTKTTIAKSWLVLAMFGYDPEYDVPLETEAIELNVQLRRIISMFNLQVQRNPEKPGDFLIRWTTKCRFALVVFSVYQSSEPSRNNTSDVPTRPAPPLLQVPWTFVHEERPGAPATFLQNNLTSTHARGWDFVTGQAYASEQPIVFSYADDPRDRHSFMKISTSANEAQQFHGPGEGGILGMGANAIVHRVKLTPTSSASLKVTPKTTPAVTGKARINTKTLQHSQSSVFLFGDESDEELSSEEGWDAAVKRPFSLSKMLAMLQSSSEAGLAKRVRFANRLNSDGRVLYFYGLGVAMSANAENQPQTPNKFEYKWEAILLARYEENFSTYTMRKFMEDYTAIPEMVPEERRAEVLKLQHSFSIISVKVLLVSLLNAFRDLTLFGVCAFDFNHLNNVLVSRDHQSVRLIDIDGNSRGSYQFPSEYIQGSASIGNESPLSPVRKVHKPALDIDLNSVLPTVILKLLLGKGRGNAFCTNTRSDIWRAKNPEDGKAIIRDVLRANFYSHLEAGGEKQNSEKHVQKVAEWFYALLKKLPPWDDAMTDIYNAMRAIDHLPIT